MHVALEVSAAEFCKGVTHPSHKQDTDTDANVSRTSKMDCLNRIRTQTTCVEDISEKLLGAD